MTSAPWCPLSPSTVFVAAIRLLFTEQPFLSIGWHPKTNSLEQDAIAPRREKKKSIFPQEIDALDTLDGQGSFHRSIFGGSARDVAPLELQNRRSMVSKCENGWEGGHWRFRFAKHWRRGERRKKLSPCSRSLNNTDVTQAENVELFCQRRDRSHELRGGTPLTFRWKGSLWQI